MSKNKPCNAEWGSWCCMLDSGHEGQHWDNRGAMWPVHPPLPVESAPAPEAEGMEQRIRDWLDANGYGRDVALDVVIDFRDCSRAEVVRALEGACKAVCSGCAGQVPICDGKRCPGTLPDPHHRRDGKATICSAAAIRKQIAEVKG